MGQLLFGLIVCWASNNTPLISEKFEERRIVEKVLITLPENFDSVASAIEQARDLSKLSVTELIGSLQAHEQRLMHRSESITEGAFQAKHKFRFKEAEKKRVEDSSSGCSKGEETTRVDESYIQRESFPLCTVCKIPNHSEKDYFRKAQCEVCKKIGHIVKYCKMELQCKICKKN